MATNFVRIGTEHQVNLPNSTNGDQFDPDVAALTDGRFFVAYEDEDSPDDGEIIGQFVNADGTLSGSPFYVEGDPGDQNNPAVAARPGGGAIVVWEDAFNPGGTLPNIQLALVNALGAVTSPSGGLDVVALTTADGTPNYNPDVATFANGQSIIVWDRTVSNSDINARVLNAAGTGFTTTDRIKIDISNGQSLAPAVAASGNKALIVYQDTRGAGNVDVRAVLFDAAADATADFSTGSKLIADKSVKLGNVDVAALTDGRYVVVYEEVDAGNVFARFVDASGNPVGAEIVVANTAADEDLARVAALPDGGFVVTWDSDASGNIDIIARRFLSDGTPGGDAVQANSAADDLQIHSAIAVNADGHAFITFQDQGSRPDDADPSGIRGGAFQAMTEVINGTLGPNSFTTYNLGETINTGPGADVVRSMGGNDTVLGGDDDDLIEGGDGDDNLKGERGVDTVNGGAGNDSVNGGENKGTLTGGPGADSFVFDVAVKKANKQTITDYAPIDDTIVLDASTFKKLDPGPLKGKNFFKGSPDDGNDYVGIKKNKVIYDKNGDGDGGATIVAVLDNKPDHFTKADILVIA